MNPVISLVNCFQSNPTLQIEENLKEVIVTVKIDDLKIPQKDKINEITGGFSARDKLTIDFKFEEMDPVTYHKGEGPEDFITEIEKFLPLIDADSEITLKVTIEKSIDEENVVSVFFLEQLTEYLRRLNLLGSLYILREILGQYEYIKFNLINERTGLNFGTNTFIFYSDNDESSRDNLDRQKILEARNSIGNFNNASDYPFIPDDFFLNKRSDNEQFNGFFDKLCALFSLIFVADFTNITENQLYAKLNGYKLIEIVLQYDAFNLKDNNHFYDIYKWIFISGSLSDKAGLARNIISLHLKQNDTLFELPENTLYSIRSGYEIYLKDNVAQYIEVKNKVSEFLMELAQRTSDLVNSFANALRNNHFLFLTFFMSVFVFNTLSTGKLKDIFNKDITYISFGLLIISYLYLLATIFQTIIETNRFKIQYNRLKKMYEDILNEQDINNIFRDEDHKEDIKFIEQKSMVYAFVWLIEIVVLYAVVYFLKI
jgi:hypothetical protein